ATVTALSAMMFLQFFVWGAWYVPVTGWLNQAGLGELTALVFTVCPIAAILSPLFLGMVADRFFASQRVLGVMHLLGAAFMFAIPLVMPHVAADTPKNIFHPLILLLLGHSLCYMPTLSLSSTVALQHISNPEKVFPIIRVLGTIGWIVAAFVITYGLQGGDKSIHQFWVVAGASAALGIYSFFLPHTNPPLAGKKVSVGQLLGLDAIKLLKGRSYFVFILCSLLICIPLAGYYAQARNYVETAFTDATQIMSFGQVSEIFFMLVIPLLFLRLGVKKMLLAGMLAWVVRYGLFAGGAADHVKWMVLGGVLLHGVCYDFFFVVGQIYVDKATSADIRGQAQGFFVLVTQGVGMIIGAQLFGKLTAIYDQSAAGGVKDWYSIWLWPALFAAAIVAVFFLFFREKREAQ
ncbi:MAG: MFS transporter, partial [Opitutaceae bacterium]|nr:MFS transporter [Opitutaceae bacterium]